MMDKNRRQFGYSLIEVMLATGILGLGLILIAMVFPVGLKLTSVTTERTVGALAADEAFAKIQMWGLPYGWPMPGQESVHYTALLGASIEWPEFFYPSADEQDAQRSYHWSAMCRRISDQDVQVTVFVTRKVAPNIQFYDHSGSLQNWPSPVPVNLHYQGNPRELWGDEYESFSGGTVLLEDRTGRLYHVQETRAAGEGLTLVLRDEGYELPEGPQTFWVIPPGFGSTRNPVVAVRQKVMRFEQGS